MRGNCIVKRLCGRILREVDGRRQRIIRFERRNNRDRREIVFSSCSNRERQPRPVHIAGNLLPNPGRLTLFTGFRDGNTGR